MASDTKAPHVVQCVDPFHLVNLANDALGAARREFWNQFRALEHPRAPWWKHPVGLAQRRGRAHRQPARGPAPAAPTLLVSLPRVAAQRGHSTVCRWLSKRPGSRPCRIPAPGRRPGEPVPTPMPAASRRPAVRAASRARRRSRRRQGRNGDLGSRAPDPAAGRCRSCPPSRPAVLLAWPGSVRRDRCGRSPRRCRNLRSRRYRTRLVRDGGMNCSRTPAVMRRLRLRARALLYEGRRGSDPRPRSGHVRGVRPTVRRHR